MRPEIASDRFIPAVWAVAPESSPGRTTLIVAPMTTAGRDYPWRVPTVFAATAGRIALDQLRTIDRARVVRRLGNLDADASRRVLDRLAEMFAP